MKFPLLTIFATLTHAHTWQHQAVFSDLGALRETIGYVHLKVLLPVDQIHQTCQTLQDWGRHLLQRTEHHFLSSVPHNLTVFHNNRLLSVCQKFNQSHVTRPKRSIWTGILSIFSFFGLSALLGLDDSKTRQIEAQQHHLVMEIQNLQLDTNLLRINQDILDSRTRQINRLTNFLLEETESHELVSIFGANVELFGNSVDTFVHGLQNLNQGLLSPDLIPTGSFQPMWSTLNSSATKLGGRIPISQLQQLYGLPFSAFGIDRQIMVVIHVPVVTSLDWNLHQLRRRPLLLPGGTNSTVLIHIRPEEDVLAVASNNEAYATMPNSNLARCIKLGHLHLCETIIAFSNASHHCLSRLFINDLRDLPHFCSIYISKQEYAVVPGDNEWLFFHKDFQPVTTTCLNGTRRIHQKQGYFALPWTPGCTFTTPMFTLAGIPTPPAETLGATINLTPTLQELIGFHIQTTELDDLAKHHGLPPTATREIPFRDLLQHRDHTNEMKDVTISRWTFSSLHGTLTLCVVALIGSLLFCTYRNFKTRQHEK